MTRLPLVVVLVGLPMALFVLAQLGPVFAAPWAGPYLMYTLYVGKFVFVRRTTPTPRRWP